MCQQSVVVIKGIAGVFSWTVGFTPSKPPENISERDVLAAAARFDRCGCGDDACSLRECWYAHPDDRATIKRLMDESWQKRLN